MQAALGARPGATKIPRIHCDQGVVAPSHEFDKPPIFGAAPAHVANTGALCIACSTGLLHEQWRQAFVDSATSGSCRRMGHADDLVASHFPTGGGCSQFGRLGRFGRAAPAGVDGLVDGGRIQQFLRQIGVIDLEV